MMNQEVTQYIPEADATPSAFSMRPRTLNEAMTFAKLMADSDLVPMTYKGKPGNILVAIQMGSELGMTPMRALRCIAVINGRASMWGDELLALVLASPECEWVDESESSDTQGVCVVKRKGHELHRSIFTVADAKRAGLWEKKGKDGYPTPWCTYPGRMLKLRARGFGLRDKFADVLAGLVTTEEAIDSEEIKEEPAIQPVNTSLKEKLKAQVEEQRQAPDSADAAPTVPPSPPSPSAEVPAPSADTPAEPWIAKQRTANSDKEARERYDATPEELKQEVWPHHMDRLKALAKKK